MIQDTSFRKDILIGVAMIPIAAPNFYANFPDWAQIILKSGITFGSITAILLNLLLNGVNHGDEIQEMGNRHALFLRSWQEILLL